MNIINDDWPWPPEMDGVLAAPESHGVLFENDTVRVLEIKISAGEREVEHTHQMPGVMIVDRPARIRYYREGIPIFSSPESSFAEAMVGQWMDPEGPHSVENIDAVPYHAFRIELKALQLRARRISHD
jgi:hypothetical protein